MPGTVRTRAGAIGVLLGWLALCPAASAAEAPEIVLLLEASFTALPGQVVEAAPHRFALLEDGDVFVGGTSDMVAGRLASSEMRGLEQELDRVRKLKGLGSSVSFGPGEARYRLSARKGRPLDITATGDPAGASVDLKPLASLITNLAAFSHASLRPYRPAFFALRAREGKLAGGCRQWGFAMPLEQVVAGPQSIPGSVVSSWPTGADAASVCSGDKTYIVTLRPLLPGERP